MKSEANITIADHEAFQREIRRPTDHFDAIDHEIAGDPIHDHLPEVHSHGKLRRVLDILDKLEQGGTK